MSIQRLRCSSVFLLLCTVMLGGNCNGGRSPARPDASSRKLLVSGDIDEVRLTPQNWTDAESNDFYNMPQGSKLIPYDSSRMRTVSPLSFCGHQAPSSPCAQMRRFRK